MVRKTTAEDRLSVRVESNIVLAKLKNVAEGRGRLKGNEARTICADLIDVLGALTGAGPTTGVVHVHIPEQRRAGMIFLLIDPGPQLRGPFSTTK